MTTVDYAIFYTTGSCGHFLKSVIHSYLTGDTSGLVLSTPAHMHEFKTKINKVVHSHSTNIEHEISRYSKKPTVILVDYDDTDIDLIARLNFEKYITEFWVAHKVYEKFNSAWDANTDPLADSIKQDILNITTKYIKAWRTEIDYSQATHIINFKTIIGLDEFDLDKQIMEITNRLPNAEIKQFINTYQLRNKELYT